MTFLSRFRAIGEEVIFTKNNVNLHTKAKIDGTLITQTRTVPTRRQFPPK